MKTTMNTILIVVVAIVCAVFVHHERNQWDAQSLTNQAQLEWNATQANLNVEQSDINMSQDGINSDILLAGRDQVEINISSVHLHRIQTDVNATVNSDIRAVNLLQAFLICSIFKGETTELDLRIQLNEMRGVCEKIGFNPEETAAILNYAERTVRKYLTIAE